MNRTVIVGFDASERSADALALGALLAHALGADVLAAYVFNGPPALARDPQLARRLNGRLEQIRTGLPADRPLPPFALVVHPAGSAAEGLEQLACAHDAAAIVVGSSAQCPLGRILIGSTPERLLHGAPCRVAVAPAGYAADSPAQLARIGVALDDGPEAAHALADAAALALQAQAQAQLHAITVVRAQPGLYVPGPLGAAQYVSYVAAEHAQESHALHEAVAALAADGREVVPEVPTGMPPIVLAERTRELDLLVLGSRSRGPLRRVLLGSVSTHLMRHAHCPLLVLPRCAETRDAAADEGAEPHGLPPRAGAAR